MFESELQVTKDDNKKNFISGVRTNYTPGVKDGDIVVYIYHQKNCEFVSGIERRTMYNRLIDCTLNS